MSGVSMNSGENDDLVLHIPASATARKDESKQRDQQGERSAASGHLDHTSSPSSSSSNPSRTTSLELRNPMARVNSSSSMLMHYFVENKKLGSDFVASTLEGPATAKAEPEPTVPPRIIVHTKMHINAMMCAALIAVLIMSYYSSITTILRLKRWYAVTVLLLVPVGAYFFSFAVNTAVCGVFSIFLGEPQGGSSREVAGGVANNVRLACNF
jgi:cation transport ATPase